MHFHFEWFSVILRLNAHELLAFVYIFVECTLPRQSPTANRVLHKRQCKLIDAIDRHIMIFLTTYFRTTASNGWHYLHIISYVINNVPSLHFVYSRLGDLQITAYFKGIYVTSGTASVYFDDADNATRKSRVSFPYSVLPVAERTFQLRLWTYHRCMNTRVQYNHAIRICIALLWRHGIVYCIVN